MPTVLTLPETVALAQRVLDENNVTPSSRRASAKLSDRVVRWYASAGVLDQPGLAGHTAVYGRRHLLQLLYIRQAQSSGASLDQIRTDLATLTTDDLAKSSLDLSLIPADLDEVQPRKEASFWERQPADEVLAAAPSVSPVTRSTAFNAFALPPSLVEYVVRVGSVSVTLDHEPTSYEVAQITASAAPLLAFLDPAVSPSIRSTS